MIFLFGVRNFHPVFGGNSQTGKSCRKPLDKSKRGNYNDLTIKLTQTKREVRDKMSLQHCLVLTVATGAVWMDLRTRRIANEWIITAWIAGLVTQLIRYGTAGAGIFLFGMLFPILALYILFYFHMLGAGDIKLLSAVGGFLGVPAILKCMIVSFMSGAVLSIGIILVCGNLPQRLTKFFNYFQTYFTKRKYQKKTEPVPYYDGKWGMECIHFSVPVLMGVLLWIGGFY